MDAENSNKALNKDELKNKSSSYQSETEASKEKSATEEVSQILTTFSASVSDFGTASKSFEMTSSTHNVIKSHTENMLADEQTDQGCHEHSSPPISSSSSSSSDEDEDESEAESSELDEEECNRRRSQCIGEMTTIEKQFMDIRDQLYRERHTQITKKLNEVNSGTAPEYLQQVQALEKSKQIRLQVSDLQRRLRVESLQTVLEADKKANTQHLNNEKKMLTEQIQSEFDEKIHRLEEDRNNVDLSTELFAIEDFDIKMGKKLKRKEESEQVFSFGPTKRRKKPVTVTGPYIVYMLKDADIVDDWTAIKMALSMSQRHKNTSKGFKKRLPCRYEDGKLIYAGKHFQQGQLVAIKNGDTTTRGTIVGISHSDVLVKQTNGTKSKLHFHQLQRGKYSLQHR
uniref:Breast cancer metastasis-suppressor 1-like protein-A n=1 Tax=Phallusia mammillata TaxID=59560 RepID=A0A6F9D8C4_9ASCI|nr:breast cancer metastasis-suppressor 1-like protein-A [Phallusia mammillata]